MPVRAVLLLAALFAPVCEASEDKDYWYSVAREEIEDAIKVKWNEGHAKNVILFIGDGMGLNTITSSRIYKGGEEAKLVFDTFPHVGLTKTYSVDKQVPDSASTATAIYSGVKTNYRVLGLHAAVKLNGCRESLDEKNALDNIFDWAYSAGKKTGFVTTTRVTHATPAAIYARCPNRQWECEAKVPIEHVKDCKDIARQLVENERGERLNVIMGGGRQCLVSNSTPAPSDPIDHWACVRKDGRNLIQEWKKIKENKGAAHAVVTNAGELQAIDQKSIDFVLGVFSNSHLNYDYNRDKSASGMPSLQEMTSAALKVLHNGNNGFVLMVEGGLIDFAHHRGHARIALDETIAFDKTINWTINWLQEKKILEETLIIVTADHDHGLAFNGHPSRGNSILGVAGVSKMDGIPYTTLTYGTGGPNNYQFLSKDGNVVRVDPSKLDTTDFLYSTQTGVLVDEVKHGGGDVIVFAKGPMAHLFHNIHEQNYIAFVAAYAAKIGPYSIRSISTFLIPSCVTILGSLVMCISFSSLLYFI